MHLGICSVAQNFRPSEAKRKELETRKERLVKKDVKFSDSEMEEIATCATAIDCRYLTELEKEFILLHNLARTNPQFFKKYVVMTYDSSFLQKIPPIAPVKRLILKPLHGLYLSAKEHAKKSGKNGTTGHQNFNSRIKKYNLFKHFNSVAENCSYNREFALLHFLSLLNSSGHFRNIMTPEFNYIGVSLKPHSKYGTNIVTCFASK